MEFITWLFFFQATRFLMKKKKRIKLKKKNMKLGPICGINFFEIEENTYTNKIFWKIVVSVKI